MRVKLALAAALATGTALVGVGVGGLVGVDRQLEAATPPRSETRVVSDGDHKRGDCPADKSREPGASSAQALAGPRGQRRLRRGKAKL